MKTIQVTDRAATMIKLCRIGNGAMIYKSYICDIMCNIIDRADESGTIANDMPLLVHLSSFAELYDELGKTPETETE
jgi:hypothetical protein